MTHRRAVPSSFGRNILTVYPLHPDDSGISLMGNRPCFGSGRPAPVAWVDREPEMARILTTAFLAAAFAFPGATAHAQTDTTSVQLYGLGTNSRFEYGCFSICACPIIFQTLGGTFELKHIGFDGLFENYAISSVRWSLPQSSSVVDIRGSGTYKVGGEVAIEQEMTLDLTVGSNAPQHFDSGLVSGGGNFPKIAIDVSVHGMQTCVDTVLHVEAAPDPPSSVEGGGGSAPGAPRVSPNPFSGHAEIALSLDRPGKVELVVYDLGGRSVRHLVGGAWLPAGPNLIRWDGLGDEGRMCAAGVYFVRAKLDGRLASLRMVKLR
jgi:hypothetical protein